MPAAGFGQLLFRLMLLSLCVQEYMAGGTLKQLVTRDMLSNGRGMYSDRDAIDICLQMARGLR